MKLIGVWMMGCFIIANVWIATIGIGDTLAHVSMAMAWIILAFIGLLWR